MVTLGLAQRAEVKAGWSEEVRHREKIVVRLVGIDAIDVHGAKRGRLKRRARPLAVLTFEHVKPVPDIFEFVQDKKILGFGRTRQRLAGSRLEQRREFAFASYVRVEVGSQQRSGQIRLSGHGPVRPQPQKHLISESAGFRIVRLVDPHPLISAADVRLVGEKGHAARDHLIGAAVIVNHRRGHADVLALAFEHGLGVRQQCPAFPLFHDAGITRTGQ